MNISILIVIFICTFPLLQSVDDKKQKDWYKNIYNQLHKQPESESEYHYM